MTDQLEQVRKEAAENGWRITGPDENGEYFVGEDEGGMFIGQIVTAIGGLHRDDPEQEWGAVHAGDGRSPVMRRSMLEAWRDLCAYHPDDPDLCLVCGVDIGDGGTVHLVRRGDGEVDDRLPLCAAHEAAHRESPAIAFDDYETPAVTDEPEMTTIFRQIERLADKLVPDAAILLSPDYAGMAVLLQLVRRAIAQLKWADEELTGELAKVLPGKETEIFGVGIATLRTGTTRKQWDKEGIVSAVTARIADDPGVWYDPDTGDALPPHEVVQQVVGAFLEVGTPSWKTTGLRAMRLDPDEYCELSYGAKTVQLPVLPPFEGREASE